MAKAPTIEELKEAMYQLLETAYYDLHMSEFAVEDILDEVWEDFYFENLDDQNLHEDGENPLEDEDDFYTDDD
jgi:hypothetical protein